MKIKFILLIVLFSVTMQSMANNKSIFSLKIATSDQTVLQEHLEEELIQAADFPILETKNKEILSSSFGLINWLTIVLILSNLILLLYMLIFKHKLSKSRVNIVEIVDLNERKGSLNTRKSSSVDSLLQQISELKGKNDKLERKNAQLEQEKEELNNENIELGRNMDDLKFQLNSNPPTELKIANRFESDSQYIITNCISESDQFYLKESKQKNQTTPYVIFENGNEFYFKFDESNPSARSNAFNFHNIYMEGYCDGVNIRTDAHTSFEIVDNSFGKLKKEVDKYLVIERIKVNYLGGK